MKDGGKERFIVVFDCEIMMVDDLLGYSGF